MLSSDSTQQAVQKIHYLEASIIRLESQNLNDQAELSLYQQRCEQYAQAYESLQHQVKELLRNRFGQKSERYIDPENPQASLFENHAALFAAAEASGEALQAPETRVVATHDRQKQSKPTQELPRRIEVIPVSEADKQCSCGACKTVIRYETKELLHHQPVVFELIEQRREVVACPNGCDASLLTAPAPFHILPKVKATEELLSFLVVSKLEDRQPLYHLEKQLESR